MKLFLIFIFTVSAFAQVTTDKDLWDINLDKNNYPEQRLKEYRKSLLINERILRSQNDDSGFGQTNYFTGEDNNRISFNYQFGTRPNKAFSHIQGDLLFGSRFEQFWLEGVLSYIRTTFEHISENRSLEETGTNSENSFPRADAQTETLYVIGLGPGYRFPVPLEYFRERDFFHHISTFLTYNRLQEDLRKKTYVGPGLRTSLSFHKRMGPGYHIGLGFSYNLASVKRSAVEEEEASTNRKLTLSWYTYGINLGFYF